MHRTLLALAVALVLPLALPSGATASPLGDAFAPALAGARSEAGLGALAEDPRLSASAQAYADLMASTGHFDHTGPDGSSQVSRAQAAGCGSRFIGENIAWGMPDASAAFSGWLNSAGHRENILHRSYRVFGVGHAGDRWVMMFADRC